MREQYFLLCFQILTTDPLVLSTLKIQVQIVGAIPTAVTNRAITTRWPTEFKIILSVLPPSRYRWYFVHPNGNRPIKLYICSYKFIGIGNILLYLIKGLGSRWMKEGNTLYRGGNHSLITIQLIYKYNNFITR